MSPDQFIVLLGGSVLIGVGVRLGWFCMGAVIEYGAQFFAAIVNAVSFLWRRS